MASRLRKRVDAWLQGESSPGLAEDLARHGFRYVLVVDRREPAVDRTAVEAALGTEVGPGVYALPAVEGGAPAPP